MTLILVLLSLKTKFDHLHPTRLKVKVMIQTPRPLSETLYSDPQPSQIHIMKVTINRGESGIISSGQYDYLNSNAGISPLRNGVAAFCHLSPKIVQVSLRRRRANQLSLMLVSMYM